MTTTETAYNLVLMDEVLHLIETEPQKWAQSSWITPADEDTYDRIITAELMRDRPGLVYESEMLSDETAGMLLDDPVTMCGAKLCFAGHAAIVAGWREHRDSFDSSTVVNPGDGSMWDISDAAAVELGISPLSPLFDGENTLETLKDAVDIYRRGGSEWEVRDLVESRKYADDEDDDYELCGCGCMDA